MRKKNTIIGTMLRTTKSSSKLEHQSTKKKKILGCFFFLFLYLQKPVMVADIEMQRTWCYRAMVPIPPNGPSHPLYPSCPLRYPHCYIYVYSHFALPTLPPSSALLENLPSSLSLLSASVFWAWSPTITYTQKLPPCLQAQCSSAASQIKQEQCKK